MRKKTERVSARRNKEKKGIIRKIKKNKEKERNRKIERDSDRESTPR